MKLLKSIRNKVLDHKKISSKLKDYYGTPPFTLDQFMASVINGNIWIFSLKKSGTTVLSNTLAFYNSQLMGEENYDFEMLAESGVSRSTHENLDHIDKISRFKMLTKLPWTVQTHGFIDAKPDKLILTIRNAEDYCVSAFHWVFKNRKGFENVNIDEALKDIMAVYVLTYQAQQKAAQNCTNVLTVKYEKLMEDSYREMHSVIEFLYGTVDENKLKKALEASSVSSLKKYEEKKGYATIARKDSLTTPHFVRSGKVGEGKEFFSKKQLDYISKCLSDNNISL